jgi:hypothetical protein
MNGKVLNVFLAILLAGGLSAQKNIIKVGSGFGNVPYEGTLGWNAELQYERKILWELSGFFSMGLNGDNFTSRGRSQGSSGGETWDNSFEYTYSEGLLYFDTGLRYPIVRIKEKYKLKLAVGVSWIHSEFEYPKNIFINRGIIEQIDMVNHKVDVGMMFFGLENHISLTKRIGLNLGINYRSAFEEKHILKREVTYHNGSSSAVSGILNVVNLSCMLSYLW